MKGALQDVWRGMKWHACAARFVFQNRRLWVYLAAPAILGFFYVAAIVWIGMRYWGDSSLSDLSLFWDATIGKIALGGGQIILVFAKNVFLSLAKFFLWAILFLVASLTCSCAVGTFFYPFLARLSEEVELVLFPGREAEQFDFWEMAHEVGRGLFLGGRQLVFFLFFFVLLLPLILLPVPFLNISCFSLALGVLNAHLFGLGWVDFTLERKKYSVRESIRFAKENRWLVTGVGLGGFALMLVPLAGWFLAPALGTVAGTLAVLDRLSFSKQN